MSEDRYRSVVDNSPFGIYRVTLDGRFVTINAALCAMVGYTANELLASNISVLYSDASDRQRWLADYEVRARGAPVDVTWTRKDNQLITARVWAYAERTAAGPIEYFDGYVENVTSLRETEQALRQAEKLAALGELVSGVAHELNNPLSAILLFTEDLLAHEERAEEREALDIIAQQARRSRAIVRDLLSFARSGDVVRGPVEVVLFFEHLVRVLAPQLAELCVTLHANVEGEATHAVLPIDRSGIEQVVTNLVINGAQAAGLGGNVWLSARRELQHFVIDVVDDGRGIADDVVPKIFEPFFTTKPMGHGTGLGLSVSRSVVQQHGGWIMAANRDAALGSGAHFTVRLPLPAPATVVAEALSELSDDSQADEPRRVLIVDDEETIRRALTRFYERRGWAVTQAEDGSRAFERLTGGGEPFDLIISDVKMPGISGIELHAAVSEVHPELLERMLFCTGEVDSAAVSAFVAGTHCRVLVKPFDLRTLAALSDDIAPIRAPRLPPIAS